MGESGKAGGDVFLGVILLPSPSPHGEFGSSLHLVVRALTQVSRLQGSFYISVQSLSRVWLFATPWIAARQASLSITNALSCSNSHPSSWWHHPTISSSVAPFSCPQSQLRLLPNGDKLTVMTTQFLTFKTFFQEEDWLWKKSSF